MALFDVLAQLTIMNLIFPHYYKYSGEPLHLPKKWQQRIPWTKFTTT